MKTKNKEINEMKPFFVHLEGFETKTIHTDLDTIHYSHGQNLGERVRYLSNNS